MNKQFSPLHVLTCMVCTCELLSCRCWCERWHRHSRGGAASDVLDCSRQGNSICNRRQASDLVDAIYTGKCFWTWIQQAVIVVVLTVLPLCMENRETLHVSLR